MSVLLLFIGCAHVGTGYYSCEITMGNRSMEPIRSVMLDPEGYGTGFGFLGGGAGSKTAGGCRLRFLKGFVIQWKEAGEIRRSVIDLSIFAARRSDIKSMTFFYVGGDKWQVIARSGNKEDSPEIVP